MQTACAVPPFADRRPGATPATGASALRAEFDFYEPEPGRPGEDDLDDDAEDFDQDEGELDDLDRAEELIRELVVPGKHPLDDV